MRDLVIVGLAVFGCFKSLRQPWFGILVWVWLSIMNPHRYTYGFAFSAPLAAMAAAATLVGLMVTRERESPFKGPPVKVFLFLILWMTLSWLLGIDPAEDYFQWNKVMKIDLMVVVSLAVMRSKLHIFALAWVATMSLALLGTKGGIFTIMTGGSGRVWGPPGSFIADNNEFALSLVMTIPLLRFLQMQVKNALGRKLLAVMMLLCAFAALGSQSRGALIAISSMGIMLWWRGSNRIGGGIAMVALAVGLVAFMPSSWSNRMNTVKTYEKDGSAMGRINAWHTAVGVANHYPFGAGFLVARPELFHRYAPDPEDIHAAHSIYFQILGNHGWVGLGLFVGLWISTWRLAGRVRQMVRGQEHLRWAGDLASMSQTALLGYMVGGSFLSLAYFDLPYNVMVLVALTYSYVTRRLWEREPALWPRPVVVPGLPYQPKKKKKKAF